jgi:putative ABC transport system substrate-binding protein
MRHVIARLLLLLLLFAVQVAHAQQPRSATLGVLLFSTPQGDPNLPVFRKALEELGYVEGRNLVTVFRYADGKPERLAQLARELVALKPDVIYALGGDVAPFVRTATNSIPIVASVSVDPVQAGLVPSLARPGGNLTGVTYVSSELAAKRLQLLKQAMPDLARVAVLWNPDHIDPEYAETQAAGKALGVRVLSLEVRRPDDLAPALRTATAERSEALIVVSSRLMMFQQPAIMEFANRERIPVVGGWGPWAQSGALFSYGPDLHESSRRAATYVDRILKGAKPGELPVERPTRFELVLNLATAERLRIAIPGSMRVQAAKLIE